VPLVITEGQKKAEKAAQEGICAVALSGVWNWKYRVGQSSIPIPDFDLLTLTNRRVVLCFDSDASSNFHICLADCGLAAFLRKQYESRVSIKLLPSGPGGTKVGIDDFLLTHTVEQFWELAEHDPNEVWRTSVLSNSDWPDPIPLGDDLPLVDDFTLELLPSSFRPLVEDVSERMQIPLDYAAVAVVVTLAGCVNRRAIIQPKAQDTSWTNVPNLWGAIVAPPGFMKSPLLRAITSPLSRIEEFWRAEYAQESTDFGARKLEAELRLTVWKEDSKKAIRAGNAAPVQPDPSLRPPTQRRLVLTDSTFEKLHEILAENSAGVLVIRDELTGWLAGLDRQGREQERAFYLEAWNGDSPFTVDRIGRGSIHVPAVCVSLLGNIQPARLRWYLSQMLGGGPNDDGLFQRFQILAWPDPPRLWKLVDRPPNAKALRTAENVYSSLVKLSADDPVRMHFDSEAQGLFFAWLSELESKIRGDLGLAPPFVAHLAKYRSLVPSLAALFQLADLAASSANLSGAIAIDLAHARQAAATCGYLESHARRAYSCIISPECRAARDLARRIKNGDLPAVFNTRNVYAKGWAGLDNPDRARAALVFLEDAGWVRRIQAAPFSRGGRPPEEWQVNPKVRRREK
jgi:putative DNA primase/helicase